jgi:hypothetical protein
MGCAAAGRCAVRFGDVEAEIVGDFGAVYAVCAVHAVVPPAARTGLACVTLDDAEGCVDFTMIDAPVLTSATLVSRA